MPSKQLQLPLLRSPTMPAKKFHLPLILILLFILSALSLFRFLRITVKTSSKTIFPPTVHPKPPLTCPNLPRHTSHMLISHQSTSFPYSNELTHKELCFLLNLISTRIPINLLVFGMRQQAPLLAALNSGGRTVFLEDMSSIEVARLRFQGFRIYKVEHGQPVGQAYDLLRRARGRDACGFRDTLRDSECELALRGLPREVYRQKWDMVIVDGPDGDRLDAAGRMAAIYSVGVLARMGSSNLTKVTDVVVHDVDRTVERWYSWEFLCEENLASSKGRFWHFQIKASVSSAFCTNPDIHKDQSTSLV